jgi:hypothetical protein
MADHVITWSVRKLAQSIAAALPTHTINQSRTTTPPLQRHLLDSTPPFAVSTYAFTAIIQQASKAITLASELRINRDPTRTHRDNLPPLPRY